MSRRKPSPAVETAHREIMARLSLTDADPALQKAFACAWQSGAGHVVLKWLIGELRTPLWSLGSPPDFAIAYAVRVEVAVLIEDMIARGQSAIEAEKNTTDDNPERNVR